MQQFTATIYARDWDNNPEADYVKIHAENLDQAIALIFDERRVEAPCRLVAEASGSTILIDTYRLWVIAIIDDQINPQQPGIIRRKV